MYESKFYIRVRPNYRGQKTEVIKEKDVTWGQAVELEGKAFSWKNHYRPDIYSKDPSESQIVVHEKCMNEM